MNLFLWNIALALTWALLTNRFDLPNLAVGFGLGYGLMLLTRRALPPTSYFRKMTQITRFTLFFLYELIAASLQVTRLVLSPRLEIRPGIVAVPLDARNSGEVTLIANLISLTPGTLSLEVSQDGHVLYVHGLDIHDNVKFVRKLKSSLEAIALEVIR